MMIEKLTNANVYLDGTDNLLGKLSKCGLPELSTEVDTHKGLGSIGSIEIPMGLAAMTAKLSWSGFYGNAVMLGANPFSVRKLQVRGSVEGYDSEGLVAEKPLVIHLHGRFKKSPLGDVEAQTATMQEQELSVHYLKVILEDRELVEIDFVNQIWRVDGKDVRPGYRANLGI